MAGSLRRHDADEGGLLPLILAKTFYDVFEFDKDRDILWRIIMAFWTTNSEGIAFKSLYDDYLDPFIRRNVTQDRVKARLIDLRNGTAKLIYFDPEITAPSQIRANTIIRPGEGSRDQLVVFLSELIGRLTDKANIEEVLRSEEKDRRIVKALSTLVNVGMATALNNVVAAIAQFAAARNQRISAETATSRILNRPGAIVIFLVLLGRAVKADFGEESGLLKSKLERAVQYHAFYGDEQFEQALHLICDEVQIVTKVKHGAKNVYEINREFQQSARLFFSKVAALQSDFVSAILTS